MPGRGEVYLVSAKSSDDTPEVKAYDNIGFKSANDDQVTFNSSKGNDLAERPKPTAPYRGMGKEDLLHFSSQPFWKRLRMIFVSIIILGWLALIITVVALVLVYPKCRDPESRSWWQKESVYRIYVPSFKDSDNDGVGDLKGIETKLDYIKNLGFSILSLSPFYKVDFKDLNSFGDGNDLAITNHTDVLDRYGTMSDFDHLLQVAHDKGMYVVIDFIPTQTSNNHPWFIESRSSTNNDMKNFYVWAENVGTPPNNWQTKTGGSAWTLDNPRNQSYLHQTSDTTPDLNLRSSMVLDKLEDIINFWLDHDVDGFNIRNSAYMFVDYDLRDEPNFPGNTGSNYEDLDHTYTSNQPELYGVLNRWRALVREYNKTEKVRVLMTGVDGGLDLSDVYQECGRSGIQMPLNLLHTSAPCEGNCIRNYVDGWMNGMPSGKWATWMAGDENTDRLATRFNASFVQAFTVLTYLLPGTPILYNGDELNMVNTGTAGSMETRNQSMRAVMAWTNATDDDFCNSTCTPWTDVSDVSTEQPMYRNLLRELADLRTNASFSVGEYHPAIRDNSIVSYVREFDGETGYLVAVNFGSSSVTRDFTVSHDTIPMEASVVLSHHSSQEVEDDVDPSSLEIGPFGAVVVSWDYVAKEL